MLEGDGVVGATRESEQVVRKYKLHLKYSPLDKETGLLLNVNGNCTSTTELGLCKQF
jgi:hypothetical protein